LSFDWEACLQQHGVAYRQDGRRELRVDCPWCNDHGHPNMSINLQGKGWYCWIDAEHRGRAPARLLAALTGMALDRARLLCGERWRDDRIDPLTQVQRLLAPPQAEIATAELRLPREFQPLALTAAAKPFVAYLQRRGFARARIAHFTRDYGLYYARDGRWRYRLVFAIVQERRLCTWTGRSIAADAPLRYLAAGADDGALPTTHTLPWFDQLTGKNRLLLCEGPFDALKLWELGEHATCCFTSAPSPRQIDLLRAVLPRYRRCVLLLDRGTVATALAARRAMIGLAVDVVTLRQRKDPAQIESREELDTILSAA
jgi:hypothetical protein